MKLKLLKNNYERTNKRYFCTPSVIAQKENIVEKTIWDICFSYFDNLTKKDDFWVFSKYCTYTWVKEIMDQKEKENQEINTKIQKIDFQIKDLLSSLEIENNTKKTFEILLQSKKLELQEFLIYTQPMFKLKYIPENIKEKKKEFFEISINEKVYRTQNQIDFKTPIIKKKEATIVKLQNIIELQEKKEALLEELAIENTDTLWDHISVLFYNNISIILTIAILMSIYFYININLLEIVNNSNIPYLNREKIYFNINQAEILPYSISETISENTNETFMLHAINKQGILYLIIKNPYITETILISLDFEITARMKILWKLLKYFFEVKKLKNQKLEKNIQFIEIKCLKYLRIFANCQQNKHNAFCSSFVKANFSCYNSIEWNEIFDKLSNMFKENVLEINKEVKIMEDNKALNILKLELENIYKEHYTKNIIKNDYFTFLKNKNSNKQTNIQEDILYFLMSKHFILFMIEDEILSVKIINDFGKDILLVYMVESVSKVEENQYIQVFTRLLSYFYIIKKNQQSEYNDNEKSQLQIEIIESICIAYFGRLKLIGNYISPDWDDVLYKLDKNILEWEIKYKKYVPQKSANTELTIKNGANILNANR